MQELIQDIRNTSGTLKMLVLSYAMLIAFGTATNQINILINQAIIWLVIPGLLLSTINKNSLFEMPKEYTYYLLMIVFFMLCFPMVQDTGRFFWTLRKCIMSLMMFIIVFRLMQAEHATPNLLFLSIFIGTLVLCVMNYANIGTTVVYVVEDSDVKEVTKIGGENTINTNALAGIAVNGILATFFLVHAYPRLKWALLSLASVFIIIVVACASKSGFLNMLMALALWYVMVYTANSRFKGINLLLFGVVAYLTFIYFTDLLEGTYLLTRFNEIESLDKYYENDARGKLIQAGLEVFFDNPVLGIGLGQIGNYINAAYTHNDITEMLSSGGIIGTFLYLSFLVIIYRRIVFIQKIFEKAGKETYKIRFMKMLFIVLMIRGISTPLFFSFDEMFMLGIVSSYAYVSLYRFTRGYDTETN